MCCTTNQSWFGMCVWYYYLKSVAFEIFRNHNSENRAFENGTHPLLKNKKQNKKTHMEGSMGEKTALAMVDLLVVPWVIVWVYLACVMDE